MSLVKTHMIKRRHSSDRHIAAAADHNEIDLRSILQIIWRRQMVLLAVILIMLSATFLLLKILPPSYSANAMIMIDAKTGKGDAMSMFLSGELDDKALLNEIEIMRSRIFMRGVVAALNLISDQEFNPSIKNSKPESAFKPLNLSGSAALFSPESEQIIDRFRKKLKIRSIPGFSFIQIEFTASQPRKAAIIANTIARLYLERRSQMQSNQTAALLSKMDARLSGLETQLQIKTKRLEDIQRTENIGSDPRQTPFSIKEREALQNNLLAAKAEQTRIRSEIDGLKALANNPERLLQSKAGQNNIAIRDLQSDYNDIKADLAALSQRYGPKHPQMQALLSAKDDIESQLKRETTDILTTLDNEAAVIKQSVQSLTRQLKASTKANAGTDRALSDIARLQQDIALAQNIYNDFSQEVEKLRLQSQLQSSNAQILSYATPPLRAAFPNVPLFLSLSFIAALFTGLALAFLLEKTDNTLRSAGQVEDLYGFPCYALIPKADLKKMKKSEPIANYVLKRPSSTVSEAVRTLRMALKLRAKTEGKDPKVIMVTSSFPGEGKTTLSCWLARLSTKSGERVLLIDADLRRSHIHKAMGHQPNKTLADYLTGRASMDEITIKDEQSDADIIYASPAPNSALDLINSARFETLLTRARDKYDLIVIDSPACMAVSDAKLLASLADHVLYNIAWDKTPREIVAGGVKQFIDMGLENLSFVLSHVDLKRHVRYGYGDSVYYYGQDSKT